MYKMSWAINDLQGLMCPKIKPSQTFYFLDWFLCLMAYQHSSVI